MAATDRKRSQFLKGFKTEGSKRIEDPTYMGFKLIFDIDGVLQIDKNTYIAPSPLLKRGTAGGAYLSTSTIQKTLSKTDAGNLRAQLLSAQSGQGSVEYLSAAGYLMQRGYIKKAKMVDQFVNLLSYIQDKSPWFFQSIEGLDEVLKVDTFSEDFDATRGDKFITINTLDSVDLRISALGDLYRKATFDFDYMRELVPKNLRRFNMWIVVTEVRNFFKTARLLQNSAALTTIDQFSDLLGKDIRQFEPTLTSSGLSSNSPNGSIGGQLLNRLGSDVGLQQDQTGIKALMIYHCTQCEFDFDSTYPVKRTIDTGSSEAIPLNNSFRIKIGKIREKNQYPLISPDGSLIVLADGPSVSGDDSMGTAINQVSDMSITNSIVNSIFSGSNPLSEVASIGLKQLGSQATRFVQNTVNEMINEGFRNLTEPLKGIDKNVMGNIYSFNPATLQGGFKGVSQFSDQFGNFRESGNIPNPQSMGLGGPPGRVYKAPSGDSYEGVPGKELGPPGRVYPAPSGDVYSNVPGTDLGVPGRVYSAPSGDVYGDVPGKDLGVPDRIYPVPSGDVYSDVPGNDLGVPGRVYPAPSGDVYGDVPGKDLGVPDRIYPEPSGDVYPTVAGTDLGVPDRVYPAPSGDVYPTVRGIDLGTPERIYPAPNGDVYPTVRGNDLGVPDRVYKAPSEDLYTNVPGKDLGVPDRIYTKPEGDIYSNVPGTDLGVPDRVYKNLTDKIYPDQEKESVYSKPQDKVYSESLGTSYKIKEKIYPDISVKKDPNTPFGDVYPDIPENLLGFGSKKIDENVYPKEIKPKLTYPNDNLNQADEFIDKHTQYLDIQEKYDRDDK
jgi:hypothetical protein